MSPPPARTAPSITEGELIEIENRGAAVESAIMAIEKQCEDHDRQWGYVPSAMSADLRALEQLDADIRRLIDVARGGSR